VPQEEWISELQTLKDIGLIRRAVKEGWMPPAQVKAKILSAINGYIDAHHSEAQTDKDQIEIFRRIADTITKMDASDTAAYRLLLDAEKAKEPTEVRVRIIQEEQP
jgi:hypothetical protein